MTYWLDMATAPKDGTPIIAWVQHDAAPYFLGEHRLTTYGAHCEGFGRCEDGLQIVVWGGEYEDSDDGHIPAWWFVQHSDFEKVANPIYWLPAPALPT